MIGRTGQDTQIIICEGTTILLVTQPENSYRPVPEFYRYACQRMDRASGHRVSI